MSLRTFLRTYREEIDRAIRENTAGTPFLAARQRFNDAERKRWTRNDTRLANWARSLGVKL